MAGDEVALSFGTAYDHFSETEEVCSLIDTLPHILRDFRAREAALERLIVIVDKYQEQPHLLDPHLELIISKLFSVVRQKDAPPILVHEAFKYIYLFTKTRGPKVIVRWFSHEVSDLEPVLTQLQQQDKSDVTTWETRYVLLLWLSIIVMIPFDLSRLDGSKKDHTHLRTINRVMEIGKLYLGESDKSRDAAVLLCAKLLSRPDVQKLKLEEFLEWVQTILLTTDDSSIYNLSLLCGVLNTLATLFKIAKREDLIKYASQILQLLTKCQYLQSSNTLLRKLHIKLTQRLGMTFLPMRVLSWRYQRGSRSLEQALTGGSISDGNSTEEIEEQNDDDFDVPDQLEDILGVLLTGLRDKDTIVRWSAAKGIGRVTNRLPKELANEVVESLLSCFSIHETDAAWHGGCLALAELGRRGLLLPQRLKDVVPVILQALLYDERRGSYSVGSHVRDAACYVCWSFARAYSPDQLNSYVHDIAKGLVIMMVFDREVNCRRAASAAFQENVGRQGIFPHGIDILTMADYFAVSNLSHVYLVLSLDVGRYPEYTHALIDHLVEYKLSHWDGLLRELASQALHKLTSLSPLYLKEKVLQRLITQVTSTDQCLRHGSLYGVAEITYALSIIAKEQNQSLGNYLGTELTNGLVGVANRLVTAAVFKGYSGENMRPAALKFIERCCLSGLVITQDTLEVWQSIIDDNLPHTVDSIREIAASTLGIVCHYHYCVTLNDIAKAQKLLVLQYEEKLQSELRFARMGYALGLGALPKLILEGKLDTVLNCLITAVSSIEGIPATYTEARRDAIRALTNICCSVDISKDGPPSHVLCESSIDKVFGALFAAMEDYTTDSRGDIGAIVREASMIALEKLCLQLLNMDSSLLKSTYVEQTIQMLAQQSNEKIDRIRLVACTKLISLIHHEPVLPHIPHHSNLLDIFNNDVVSQLNWSVAEVSFPYTIQLLKLSSYRYRTLVGLVVSVGGLTESLVRYSSTSLLNYLKDITTCYEKLNEFCQELIHILKSHTKNPRVIIPLFKTLDLLLSNGIFELYLHNNNICDDKTSYFPELLMETLKVEIKGSRDPVKILSSINVFCGLLQFSSIRTSCLNQLMILLGHSYPKVRRTAADQFYVTLLTYDDLLPVDIIDEVMSILTETTWDGMIQSVREQRNLLCSIIHLPVPKSKVSDNRTMKSNKDDMDYRDLVERMGY